MRFTLSALAVTALAGCAVAPVVDEGGSQFSIGVAGRDALRSDSSSRSHNYSRAVATCAGRGLRLQVIERTPPDGVYRFACIEPPPPPSPPPPPVATEQQLNDARAVWRDCLETAEPAIDDMISDANTVATVLATRCEPQFTGLLDLTQMGSKYVSPASAFHQVRHGVALDVVLRVRAQRRNPKAAPPPVTIPRLTP